ncbi:zinc ABC transporter substrate-binding protein [Paracoccus tegillarcae]|uniref:High-affinity zinc uptake system protein ZnuA n=1 Tax=Paracoccus tegillarcae TaxID=1529068 RepID=A0A2K9EKD3_9RHOB|nr:zinc ABC transporter substrate-binding protein [Paracoccus tegillarcae]AUH33857.1 zinc ABC transporter substrate-binding protein [Paracoccus tegillarcae]
MRILTALPALAALTALPALAETPSVIADIPATGALVQQVLGDLGTVQVLLPTGGNAHHHQLRPSDAAALQDAGLLVWIGPELTPWLERSAAALASGTSLLLLAQSDTHRRDFNADAHGHEGDHDHDHDHSGVDPHAWLDPENGKLWLTVIAEALSTADPGNAATYAQNAADGAGQLDQVIQQVSAQLAPVADAHFLVFHDAYGYFTDRFGLEPAVAVALGDASSPSAARLSAIRDEIKAESVRCAFPEIGHDPGLIDSLIDGTDIRVGDTLDPSGAGQEMGAQLYPALLQQMGDTIADCLSEG